MPRFRGGDAGSIHAPGISNLGTRPSGADNPPVNEPWFPRRSETERHKCRANHFYDLEVECREQGWGDPAFTYDEEKDLFR
jgi:hypothetical protein